MDTKTPSSFWWLKTTPAVTQDNENNLIVPKLDLHSSSSIVDLLEKDKNSNYESEVDVGSIIEEINRVAAQSPLGPYEKSIGERSIDDIMREAERVYMESSKSFEQLSQRSKTSQNITDLLSNLSKDSTPTPKSVSPLPMDPEPQYSSASDDDYTEDFSEESKIQSNPSPIEKGDNKISELFVDAKEARESSSEDEQIITGKEIENVKSISIDISKSKSNTSIKDIPTSVQGKRHNELETENLEERLTLVNTKDSASELDNERLERLNEVIHLKNSLIKTLEVNNNSLKNDINDIKVRDLDNIYCMSIVISIFQDNFLYKTNWPSVLFNSNKCLVY